MPGWLWNKVEDDGSAWSANPEPEFHLAVQRVGIGWDWRLLGPRGAVIVQNHDLPGADAAKIQAEQCYRAYVEHGLKRRPMDGPTG